MDIILTLFVIGHIFELIGDEFMGGLEFKIILALIIFSFILASYLVYMCTVIIIRRNK